MSGPSGYGYTYPNNWPNQTALNQFVAKTENYNRRAGFRVITIWNTITGGINQNVGQSFAANAPYTLGLTAQNTGGGMTIYNNSLPGMALSCNYCTNEQAMKDHIATAAAGWNGTSPRFIIIQAQPWTNVTPTSFKNVANSLNTNYQVVSIYISADAGGEWLASESAIVSQESGIAVMQAFNAGHYQLIY
ncbi:hypothetical protein [Chitinophaga pinensis]|uniref:hypothetical protein n=1 Tax=Chitinophaga pinensis TaxID=79329 RepID=UPI0021BDB918|nr:hypothetical protein [Chitinophaga pinensis]